MKKIFFYVLSISALAISSCKKDYLETVPSNAVFEAELFKKVDGIYSALSGTTKGLFAYGTGASAVRHDAFGQKGYDLSQDLMGNDIVVHAQGYNWFNPTYQYTEFQSAVTNRQPDLAWFFYYNTIGQCNNILFNLDNVTDATPAQKDGIKGELLGLRAYSYFYLVNLFQQSYKGHESAPGVPVYVVPAIQGNPRGTVQEVYNRIQEDLEEAEILLAGKPRVSKDHIDISVIQGFIARVALLQEDWATAKTYANRARQGYTPMDAATYASRSAFSALESNSEHMWGSTIPDAEATVLASFYSHIDVSVGGYAQLGPQQKKITKALYDQIPTGDVRKTRFVAPPGSGVNVAYNQIKFRTPVASSWAADYVFMRASEMYLIEAEALARQGGQDAAARTVLSEMVQARFPAYDASSLSGQSLIDEILLQRRIELWGEGFALMDIKRLNQGLNRPSGAGNHGAPSYDPIVYTTSPNDPRFLMRIPARELDNNTNMTPADQNP